MPTSGNGNLHEDWKRARLIPSGKANQTEQERRATSALLAVLPIVPSFTKSILGDLGAPGGKQIATYTEVRLKDDRGKAHIPDGAICVTRGKTTWTCLVEVKTGKAPLKTEQVERYLDVARVNDFDALLTISNQIRSDAKALPFHCDKRKIGRLTVRHISWWRILTEAIVEHRFRGVSDPEQAWVLNELIRYLDDAKSGAGGLEGMGEDWVKIRRGAGDRTLHPGDPAVHSVAAHWQQFTEYLCLHLSQELGVDVKNQKPRSKKPKERLAAAAKQLAEDGMLAGGFKVPDAVGPIDLEANLRTKRVTTTVELPAPKDVKRPSARVNWLLRQLKEAPDDVRLEAHFVNSKRAASALLGECRDTPERLLLGDDPKRQPRGFVIGQSKKMGMKNGLGQGTFIGETRRQAAGFYRDLVQDLSLPRPKAPKLPKKEEAKKPAQAEKETRKEQRRSLAEIGDLSALGYPEFQ